MKLRVLSASIVLIATLLSGCFSQAPRAPVGDIPARDPYCEAFDRTARSFGFQLETWAALHPQERDARSLPSMISFWGYYPLKWKSEEVFEQYKIESYTELLHDMVFVFNETHRRLSKCGHCLDNFIGKVFVEYLPGYALHPSVTLTDYEFATRAIEFLGEMGEDLGKRLEWKAPAEKIDFSTFWDYFYEAVDKCWRDDDFGGLLSWKNIFFLIRLPSQPYVNKALQTDGRIIYRDWLKCGDLPIADQMPDPARLLTADSREAKAVVAPNAAAFKKRLRNMENPEVQGTVRALSSAVGVSTETKDSKMAAFSLQAKPSEEKDYCSVLDQWIEVFTPHSIGFMLLARAIPEDLTYLLPIAKELLKGFFDDLNMHDYNKLLSDLIFVLKETHNRLSRCNHCLNHVVGAILGDYLVGHAEHPSLTVTEAEFADRLIEFMSQLADELQRRMNEDASTLDFDGFWDIVYNAFDAEWQGDDDFGGLLTVDNALKLVGAFSDEAVQEKLKIEGSKLYHDDLKCTGH